MKSFFKFDPSMLGTFTKAETSKLLRVDIRTVQKLIDEGKLETIPVGKLNKIPLWSMVEWQTGQRDVLENILDSLNDGSSYSQTMN